MHKYPGSIPICALPTPDKKQLLRGGEALDELVREVVRGEVRELSITVPLCDDKTVHTIENRAEVLDRDYARNEQGEDVVTLRAKIGLRQLDQLHSAGAQMTITGDLPERRRQGWGLRR